MPAILMIGVSLASYGQVQIGTDIDEATGYFSASSVSLSGDRTTMAFGAHHDLGNGSESGHVRVYKNNAGIWTQIGADIDGKAARDYSGTSVSLSKDGTIVAIGAHQGGRSPSYVSVYKNVSEAWIQVGADIDGGATYDFQDGL